MKIQNIGFSSFFAILIFITFVSCSNENEKEPPKVQQPEVQNSEVQKDTKSDVTKKDTVKTEPQKSSSQTEVNENTGTASVPGRYEVQDGETLASIADKFYGDSGKWFYIFAENEPEINNWNKIYIGQKLEMPSTEDVEN